MKTKETLQVPEGMEFSHVDEQGIIHLKEKKKTYPTTIQDLGLNEAYYVDLMGKACVGGVGVEESNIFFDETTAKAMSAFMFLVTMCQAWNKIDEFTPVFDGSIYNYCVVCMDGKIKIDTFQITSAPLAFKNAKTATKFIETFRDKIEEAKSLI